MNIDLLKNKRMDLIPHKEIKSAQVLIIEGQKDVFKDNRWQVWMVIFNN
jgi:hypothetical protein